MQGSNRAKEGMNKIKILRIIARLNIGGPAQHVVFLSEGLDEKMFETVLVTGTPESSEGDMSNLAQERGLRLINVPHLKREVSPVNDLKAVRDIFRIILKEKPDIIHTHTAKAGALGRFAGVFYNIFSRNKCKLVHTFHGHVLAEYFSRFKTAVFVLIERILAHFTDRLIAVSESVRTDLLKRRIGDPKKIIMVPLGLELKRFLDVAEKPKVPDNSSVFRIGIIGRLVPIKNHRMFLDSAKAFSVLYPASAAKFMIIGDGELRDELEDYARGLGLERKVEFTGWRRDLEKVYANLDIVCLTSVNEGTPVSIIEAMAAAKPVVATDVGGINEMLGGDPSLSSQSEGMRICQRGIIVKSGDAKALAEGMNTLVEDRGLSEKIGRASKDFAKKTFPKERLVSDMEKLYISLFERRQ